MSTVTAVEDNTPFLTKAYALQNPEQARKLYDDWAATYEADVTKESQDYVAPGLASKYVCKLLGAATIGESIEILDAGCGTGLVGIHLAKDGAKKIDGVDLSSGMLKVARGTGVYRNLDTADLSQPLSAKDKSYDVVVCIGTLTQGHVGPAALADFVRVVKTKGLIVATILDYIWEKDGYRAEVDKLVSEGKAELVSAELEEYRRGAGVKAIMAVLRVL